MLPLMTYIALFITVLITGYYAALFVRDPELAMVKATLVIPTTITMVLTIVVITVL